jgi:hypothetical protein
MICDWRWTEEHQGKMQRPVIGADGKAVKNADGTDKTVEVEERDSGIYLRGSSKSQVNIWSWPVGSGEVWGYRTDPSMPADVRAAVTPKMPADAPIGQWNRFRIRMVGETLNVWLNGKHVIVDAAHSAINRVVDALIGGRDDEAVLIVTAIETVRPKPTCQCIVPGPAKKAVLPVVAAQHVVPGIDKVVAKARLDIVVTETPRNAVVAVAAIDDVCLRPAQHKVVAFAAEKTVDALPANERIVARIADQIVRPDATGN